MGLNSFCINPKFIWNSLRFEYRNHKCGKLKNVHKFENLSHSDSYFCVLRPINAHTEKVKLGWYWLNVSHVRTRNICVDMCKIWSFYDQACGQKDCPQTTMTIPQMTRTMLLPDNGGQQHRTDNSWLHRLFGIAEKWSSPLLPCRPAIKF